VVAVVHAGTDEPRYAGSPPGPYAHRRTFFTTSCAASGISLPISFPSSRIAPSVSGSIGEQIRRRTVGFLVLSSRVEEAREDQQ